MYLSKKSLLLFIIGYDSWAFKIQTAFSRIHDRDRHSKHLQGCYNQLRNIQIRHPIYLKLIGEGVC